MKQNLFQEINEQSKVLKDLCESLGMKKEDIPQELLNEIGLDPRGKLPMSDEARLHKSDMKGDYEWRAGLGGREPAQTSYRGREGGPRDLPPGAEPAEPRMDDFLKIGNNLVKVTKVFDQFGNTFVLYQGGEKPIMTSNLKLDKEVGGKRVFVPTV